MKIVICGSMKFSKEMLKIKEKLNSLGLNDVVVPRDADKYASNQLAEENSYESIKNKIEEDLIRSHYEEIKNADAVLIVNYDKNGLANYIGGNSFLEAAFAHVLKKKLYLLFEIPNMSYSDELKAMQPIILNNDLSKIIS
jgi:predicted RND superfamily exporter protein